MLSKLLFAIMIVFINSITYVIGQETIIHYPDIINLISHQDNIVLDKSIPPQLIMENNKILGYAYQLRPMGFVLIAHNKIDKLVAYSFDNNFEISSETEEMFVKNVLKSHLDINLEAISEKINKKIQKITVGPLINSFFGQVNCYDEDFNLINVSNLFTPNNYAPGCVAISLATVMNYYQWPTQGMGNHFYSDTKGSSQGSYSANFEETTYDWENILDRYKYKTTSQEEKEALGELVYHAATALDMDYEYNGSTSNVNRIPNAIKKYFRFTAKRVSATSPLFWKAVDTNLVHSIPVIFSIRANNNAGHSIVCDGFKIDDNGDEFHHLNMGWWGTTNGWYNIKNGFDVGGYKTIDDGIINFLPVPMLLKPEYDEAFSSLTINWNISNKIQPDAYELHVKEEGYPWEIVPDTIKDTTYIYPIDGSTTKVQFRVQAKINGKWQNDAWSNIVEWDKDMVGIEEHENDNLTWQIAPNPFQHFLDIKINGEIQIYNLSGRLIYAANNNESNIKPIETTNWKNGIYIAKIKTKNKIRFVKLIHIN